MQPTTNSLINITRKAARTLQRDFLELESLQSSSRGTSEFCQRSYMRAKATLHEESQKHTRYVYFADESEPNLDKADTVILIYPIEGLDNLSKALPFFAISIVYLRRINSILVPSNAVMSFPALNEIYYAEKNGGVWLDRMTGNSSDRSIRLRVSACKDTQNAFFAGNDPKKAAFGKNQLHYGSACYNLALFAAGKLDIIQADLLNYTLVPLYNLIISEANGFVISNKEQMLGANINLRDKLSTL